jgi:hypothetical protein
VLWLPLALLAGCGGDTSANKGYDHFIAAVQALKAGDKDVAMTELTATIDSSPSSWAYFERARIHLEKDLEQDALNDTQKGLELDPKDRNLLWLSTELKKPAAQRFKGRFANPPVLK